MAMTYKVHGQVPPERPMEIPVTMERVRNTRFTVFWGVCRFRQMQNTTTRSTTGSCLWGLALR